jgi:hypothetical protein
MVSIVTSDDFVPSKQTAPSKDAGAQINNLLEVVNAVLSNPLVQGIGQAVTQKIQISNAERAKAFNSKSDGAEAVVLFEDR